MRVTFPLLTSALALSVSACSETGLSALPHETDRVHFPFQEATSLCLPPDETICHIDAETGEYDPECRSLTGQVLSRFAENFDRNGYDLGRFAGGEYETTIMAHGYEQIGDHHEQIYTLAQLVFIPGNHYHALHAIARPEFLSPLWFAGTEGFPEDLFALACKAETSHSSASSFDDAHYYFEDFYNMDYYTGMDFEDNPDVYSGGFVNGVASGYLYTLRNTGETLYSGVTRCEDNPDENGQAGPCGHFVASSSSINPSPMLQTGIDAFTDWTEDYLDWARRLANLPDLTAENDHIETVQLYFCTDGECFQDE